MLAIGLAGLGAFLFLLWLVIGAPWLRSIAAGAWGLSVAIFILPLMILLQAKLTSRKRKQ